MVEADQILAKVYKALGIADLAPNEKYEKIDKIVIKLAELNDATKINAKTTGTISERLCELALKSAIPNGYKSIGGDWNWMADFSITGHPFNLLVSVTSCKAKVRLLV